jgi:hypothetical protein
VSDITTDTGPSGHGAASAPGERPRLSNAEKVRKFRERKARGVVATVPVEIDERTLRMLAFGSQIDAEMLRVDRRLLAATASRVLRHLAKYYAETGSLPRVPSKFPTG